MASIPFASFSPLIKSHINTSKRSLFTSNFTTNSTSQLKLESISLRNGKFRLAPVTRVSKSSNGGSLSVFACSTSYPFIGKVGLHRRESNFTFLSFGTNPENVAQVSVKNDSSQIFSAMLPFVVALTAVAALTQPSTFT